MYPKNLAKVTLAAFAFATVCFGQGSVFSLDGGSQIQTVNTHHGESYFNFTNSGFTFMGLGSGNICVNVYTFDSTPTMNLCCSLLVKPNQTLNVAINKELRRLPVTPDSVTAVVLASALGTGTCANSASTVTQAFIIPFGLTAWKKADFSSAAQVQPGWGPWSETAFTPFILGPATVSQLTTACASAALTTCTSTQAGAQ
jgi:hypothetical protein